MVQTISNPKNQSAHIKVEPGQTVAFDFDISTAGFERSGNDLTLNLEDGGQIVLNDFFLADGSGALPALRLADGTEVASNDFLSAIAPELDITPSAEAIASTGLNTYTDSAGELIDGLDASGTLTPFFWGNTGDAAETPPSSGTALLADAPTALTPPTHLDPPTPPAPPVDPVSAYDARAVLYTQDGAADAFNFRLDAGKSLADVDRIESLNGVVDVASLSGPDADGGFYSLNTSAAGGSANIYDYITIYYTDGSYKVIQVILNQDGSYSSAAEDTANPPGGAIAGEWHTQTGNTTSTGGSGRSTSNGNDAGNDEFWLQQVQATGSGQNHINTGGGDDQIQIANGVQASDDSSNSISTDDGDDIIRIDGSLEASEYGYNYINAASGNDSISINGGLQASEGGFNEISAGDGADQIRIATGVHAFRDSSNTISTGFEAGDSIEIDQNVGAQFGGKNDISSESISVTSSMGMSTLSAKDASSLNELTVSDGNLSISKVATANNMAVEAADGGTNHLTATGTGEINIEVGGGADVRAVSAAGEVTDSTIPGSPLSVPSTNVVNAVNNVNISAGADHNGTRSTALHAENSGRNSVTSEASVTVSAAANGANLSGGGYAKGLYAATDGTNEIQAKDIAVKADNAQEAYGLQADGGSNYIAAVSSLSIEAQSDAGGQAYGLQAQGVDGRNEITALDTNQTINVTINASQGAFGSGTAIQAKDEGENIILGSNGDDTISVSGNIQASEYGYNQIDAGSGDDTININGGLLAEGRGVNSINSSDGDDAITINGLEASQDGRNYIDAGDGDDAISINDNLQASEYGSNNVYAGSGDDDISISGGVHASKYGHNQIFGGDGDDAITINGLEASQDGRNYIDAGDGDDAISINGDLRAKDGSNYIDAGDDGDDAISIGGNLQASEYGRNYIDAGDDGNDAISIGGNLQASEYGNNNVYAGSGDDAISIGGGLQAAEYGYNYIDAASGDDDISISGGVHASENGRNIIDGNSGDDTVSIDGDLQASEYGKNEIYGRDGNDSISIGGDVKADKGTYNGSIYSENKIYGGDGDDDISIGGVQASDRGRNQIHAGDDDDTITINGNMQASEKGKNFIYAGDGKDAVTIDGGLEASNGGSNSISTGGGDDSILITHDIYAVEGSNNTISTGDGVDSINIARNIYAGKDSNNTISTDFGAGDSINIGQSVIARSGGANDISSYGISLSGSHGTPALSALNAGSLNKLMASDGGLSISKDGTSNSIVVQAADGGANRLTATGTGEINIEIGSSMGARAVSASGIDGQDSAGNEIRAQNEISAWKNINISAGADHSGTDNIAVYAEKNASNTITSRADVTLSAAADGSGYAKGLCAAGDITPDVNHMITTNKISAKNIEAKADNAQDVYAVQADGGKNIFKAQDSLSLSAAQAGQFAYGVRVENNGRNYLDSGGLFQVTVEGAGESAAAISAFGAGRSEIRSQSDLQLNVSNAGQRAVGIESLKDENYTGREIADNYVFAADTMGITVTGGDAIGLYANNNRGTNIAGGTQALTINVTGTRTDNQGNAIGLQATNGGRNSVGGGSALSIEAHSDADGQAYGLQSTGTYSKNSIGTASNQAVTITITATKGALAGVAVDANGGVNSIDSGDKDDVLTFNGDVQANGGANFIFAWDGDDTLNFNGNIIAAGRGANQIVGGDGNDIINFNGNVQANGGGENKIAGGNGDDIITINGNMQATGGSTYILGGDGNDTVRINGDIQGRNNIFTDAGSQNPNDTGDDSIILNGRVGVGALQIKAAGGYDQLTLQAGDLDEFNDRYQAWLEQISTRWNLTEIESVRVELGGDVNLDGLNWLNNVFSNNDVDFILDASPNSSTMELMGSFSMGSGDDSFTLTGDIDFMGGLNLSGGDGMDALKLGLLDESSLDLQTLANMLEHFEVLDLSGGNGTNLTIDSLLDGLSINAALDASSIGENSSSVSSTDLANGTVLRVTGDTTEHTDSVSLGGAWNSSSSGTVEYDGITYNVYTNTDLSSQDQYLLIQAGLI